MQNQPINTSPLKDFLSLVKSAESSRQKEIRLDIDKAKRLQFCLTLMLARHVENLEELLMKKQDEENNPIIDIKMDGGSSW